MYVVLTVIVMIMGRSICSVNSYCENNVISICNANSYCDNNGRYICSVNSYCENNGEIYM
jgi:hypothetical protein